MILANAEKRKNQILSELKEDQSEQYAKEFQSINKDKQLLLVEIDQKNKLLQQMKDLIRQKDDALRSFESRKATINILVYKIKQIDSNFRKEKNKLEAINKADVQTLYKEIDALQHTLRNILFQDSKRLNLQSKREEVDHLPEADTNSQLMMEKESLNLKQRSSMPEHTILLGNQTKDGSTDKQGHNIETNRHLLSKSNFVSSVNLVE